MIHVTTIPATTYITKSKIPGAGYVINPYVGCPHKCLYCYAEFMRKFSGHKEAWGDFLDVKICSTPLPVQKLFHQHVMLSSVTDPYNIFEKKYRLTRKIIQELLPCQPKLLILTKSALVVRDIDLLSQFTDCEICFSFSTACEETRLKLEPCTSTIEEKVAALKTLHQAGLRTAVMIAPLLPGISNWKQIVQETAPYVNTFRFDSLNMKGTFQRRFMDFIDVNYPHLLSLYHSIYSQQNTDYWDKLQQEIRQYAKQQQLDIEIFFGYGTSNAKQGQATAFTLEEDTSLEPSQPQLF